VLDKDNSLYPRENLPINGRFRVLKASEHPPTGEDRQTRIPLVKPAFTKEMEKVAADALWTEFFVGGESVHKFEEEFAKYCGVDYAVSMNSGTDALQIALAASGIGKKQEVITTSASFVATSNVVLHVGAMPVFADIDLETYTVDPKRIKKLVRKKTKAVIPVHLYGYPADMESINEIAARNGLLVIEDACQAHGALYKGRRAGSLGDVACFSFYPSKNMTVGGDGGILVTDDEKIAGMFTIWSDTLLG
jgi:perosamine synthetase